MSRSDKQIVDNTR